MYLLIGNFIQREWFDPDNIFTSDKLLQLNKQKWFMGGVFCCFDLKICSRHI